jgi:CheY-like chemotaxis protein
MADDRSKRGAILLVEDDPHLRDALARLLEGEGHEVLQAADGASAVALMRAKRPDLLLLDDVMPGMHGGVVLDAVRAELADATPPALLMTAAGRDARAVEAGVQDLEKPFNVPELLDAVERYLAEMRGSAC